MKIGGRWLLLASLFVLIVLAGCQKTGGALENNEQALVVETSPIANGHVEAPAPGPDFPLVVTIKSTMPPSGVRIEVTARPDGGTVPFFTYSAVSLTPVTNIVITGAPSGVVAVVNIVVTSVSNPSSKFTGSYKFSKK